MDNASSFRGRSDTPARHVDTCVTELETHYANVGLLSVSSWMH